MPAPDFVLELRRHIGTTPLWLVGVTAVVVDEPPAGAPRVLLVRRADSGAWTPVTGIVDPGEHPVVAAVREVAEEAGVTAVAGRLVQVGVTAEVVYPHGDRTQYVDLTFRCSPAGDPGEPAPLDGENSEARWVALADLAALDPPVSRHMLARIDAALADDPQPRMVLRED